MCYTYFNLIMVSGLFIHLEGRRDLTKINKIEEFRKMSNNQLLKERKERLIPAIGFILLVALASMFIMSMVGCATVKTPTAPVMVSEETIWNNAGFEGDVKIAQMSQDCSSQSVYVEKVVKYILQVKGVPTPTTIDVEPRPGSSLCGDMQGMTNVIMMPSLGARNIGVFHIALRWRSITLRDHEKAERVMRSMAPQPTK